MAAVYPATTSAEAIELLIQNSNQLHEIINGDITTTVATFEGLGNIPSVAKAMYDAAAIKQPINWSAGGTETELLQARLFEGNVYVPLFVPAPMGAAPDAANWRLYQPKTRVNFNTESQTGADIVANVTTIAGWEYSVGENNLWVFVDGSFVMPGTLYTETSSTTITWNVSIDSAADIDLISGVFVSGDIDAPYIQSLVDAAEAAKEDAETAQAAAEAARDSVGKLTITPATSPHVATNSNNNSVLVFNEADPEIEVPDGLDIGINISFRNKQGTGVTITPTGLSSVDGAGTVTNANTKVNSLYIEDASTIVTVGDFA